MKSIKFRLTVWFGAVVTMVTLATVWIGHRLLEREMLVGIDFLLDAEVREITARTDNTTTREQLLDAVNEHATIDAPLYFFQVHRDGEGLIFRSSNLGDQVLPDLTGTTPMVRSYQLGNLHLREMEFHHHDLHLQVATSLAQYDEMTNRFQRILAWGTPILLLGSIGISWMLVQVVLRPLGAMQKSAQRITASNLSERLPVPLGNDEIAQLARLLNNLFARLEAAFEQTKRFTADASHELRTPLSLIRLYAERLAASPNLGSSESAQIDQQIEEIARLNRLVENLLMLARADAGDLGLRLKLEPTQSFLASFAEDASALADDQQKQFSLATHGAATARFDPIMLRHALLNVFTNALRHAPEESTISLTSEIKSGRWIMTLEDDGPGIPAERIPQVFERFVRFDPTSDGRLSGSGLGLAITKSIVEAHAGTIAAENRTTTGLRVVITIPIAGKLCDGDTKESAGSTERPAFTP